MKCLSALALFSFLFATFIATSAPAVGTKHTAERHAEHGLGNRGAAHVPAGNMYPDVVATCDLHCAALAEVFTAQHEFFRVQWLWDGFPIGRGIAPQGTAPEVAEHPPKQIVA